MTAIVPTSVVDPPWHDGAAGRTARKHTPSQARTRGRADACSIQERTSAPMSPVFIANLQARSAMSRALCDDLTAIVAQRRSVVPRNGMIGHDSESPSITIVESGMACRRQVLANGDQQVTCLVLPGEIFDPCSVYVSCGGRPLQALTEVGIATVAVADVRRLMVRHGEFETALQWQIRAADEIQHMWIANLGRRPALGRMAHFFCEIAVRLDTVGLVRGGSFDLPLTQVDIANILGLSVIHTNRVLQDLRSMQLLDLHGRTASIASITKLRSVAMFDPGYLHLHNV